MRQPINERAIVKGRILESDKSKLREGVLCSVRYPIYTFGKLNRNRRMYESGIYDIVVGNADVKEKLDNRCLFMQEEHPAEGNQTKTGNIAGVTTGFTLNRNENVAYADMDVLDTPMGRIVDTLLRAGCGIGTSTRAEGELEEAVEESTGETYHRVITEAYNFLAVDFTADPSTYGSYPQDIQRNITGIVRQGVGEGNLAKKTAVAILEAMNVTEAKQLRETMALCHGSCQNGCARIRTGKCACAESKDEAKEVIKVPRTVYDNKCPHCNEMIHEKGVYSDDNGKTMRHGACKGVIEYPNESGKLSKEEMKKIGDGIVKFVQEKNRDIRANESQQSTVMAELKSREYMKHIRQNDVPGKVQDGLGNDLQEGDTVVAIDNAESGFSDGGRSPKHEIKIGTIHVIEDTVYDDSSEQGVVSIDGAEYDDWLFAKIDNEGHIIYPKGSARESKGSKARKHFRIHEFAAQPKMSWYLAKLAKDVEMESQRNKGKKVFNAGTEVIVRKPTSEDEANHLLKFGSYSIAVPNAEVQSYINPEDIKEAKLPKDIEKDMGRATHELGADRLKLAAYAQQRANGKSHEDAVAAVKQKMSEITKKHKDAEGVEYWADPEMGPDGKIFWVVVAQAPGFTATEAYDNWFAKQADADAIAQKLAKGEDVGEAKKNKVAAFLKENNGVAPEMLIMAGHNPKNVKYVWYYDDASKEVIGSDVKSHDDKVFSDVGSKEDKIRGRVFDYMGKKFLIIYGTVASSRNPSDEEIRDIYLKVTQAYPEHIDFVVDEKGAEMSIAERRIREATVTKRSDGVYDFKGIFFPGKKAPYEENYDISIGGDSGDIIGDAFYDAERGGVEVNGVLKSKSEILSQHRLDLSKRTIEQAVEEMVIDIVEEAYESIQAETFSGKSSAGPKITEGSRRGHGGLREDTEDAEPEEGDITTEDHEHWFQYGKPYHTGDYPSLKAKMDADKFWPNVFWVSDHGNAHLVTESTIKEAKPSDLIQGDVTKDGHTIGFLARVGRTPLDRGDDDILKQFVFVSDTDEYISLEDELMDDNLQELINKLKAQGLTFIPKSQSRDLADVAQNRLDARESRLTLRTAKGGAKMLNENTLSQLIQRVKSNRFLRETKMITEPVKQFIYESKTVSELSERLLKVVKESFNREALALAERDTAINRVTEIEENYTNDILAHAGIIKKKTDEDVGMTKARVDLESITKQLKAVTEAKDKEIAELKSAKKTLTESTAVTLTKAAGEIKAIYEKKMKEMQAVHAQEITKLNEAHAQDLFQKTVVSKKIDESGLKLPESCVTLLRKAKTAEEVDRLISQFRRDIKEDLLHYSGTVEIPASTGESKQTGEATGPAKTKEVLSYIK